MTLAMRLSASNHSRRVAGRVLLAAEAAPPSPKLSAGMAMAKATIGWMEYRHIENALRRRRLSLKMKAIAAFTKLASK